MKGLLHVAAGGCCRLLRTAAVLTGAQVGRVPVPPVVLAVCLLVEIVVLRRLAEELCKGCDVHGSCPRQLPLAAGKPRLDLLKKPAVPVRVLERGKREVGTTLRVAPGDAWVLHGVVEGAGGVVEDLAHVDAAGDQVVPGRVDVVHGEDQTVPRARDGRRDSVAEDDRGFRVVRRNLHAAEVAGRDVDVEPPAEILVERLRAVNVGNAEQHDFEFHVGLYFFLFGHCVFSFQYIELPRQPFLRILSPTESSLSRITLRLWRPRCQLSWSQRRCCRGWFSSTDTSGAHNPPLGIKARNG